MNTHTSSYARPQTCPVLLKSSMLLGVSQLVVVAATLLFTTATTSTVDNPPLLSDGIPADLDHAYVTLPASRESPIARLAPPRFPVPCESLTPSPTRFALTHHSTLASTISHKQSGYGKEEHMKAYTSTKALSHRFQE